MLAESPAGATITNKGQEIRYEDAQILANKILDLLEGLNVTASKFVLQQALFNLDNRAYVGLEINGTSNHQTDKLQ